DLYFFNEAPDGTAPNQWEKYGTGTVSEDGTRIITDLNPATGRPYGIPRFCCGGRVNVRLSLSDQVRTRHAQGGEPVDLPTGRFTVRKTDLVLPGRLPLTLERFYRNDSPLGGSGWSLAAPYEHRLFSSASGLTLVLGDQSAYPFTEAAPGRWENRTEPFLRGAVITHLPGPQTFELRLKDGTVQRYEALAGANNVAGLVALTDRTGNTLTITREVVGTALGRILRLTEPGGRSLTFSYGAPGGRLSAVMDPLLRQVRYSYDNQGRLETVTDPAGGVTRYTYDSTNRILAITDPRGITYLRNEYDAQGRVVRQTQADGGEWTFSYQLVGSAVLATTVTDPRGNATTYRFNGQGFTVSQTDALGQMTGFDYEPGSNLLRSTTDPLGRTTRFTSDAQGNVMTITDPAGNVRTFTYEATFNTVTSITDPLGNVTRFEYDGAGNLTAIVDPLGARTTIAYNGFGQPVSTMDPLGHTTTFAYDAQGNLTIITDPLGSATQRTYDLVSRLITQTDPRGQRTTVVHDALNRLRQITDALNGLTRFAYDPNGNLLTVTDARGTTTTHTYDLMDRLATRTDPVGAGEFFEYDGGGNLTWHADRKGQVSTFTYDPLNRRSGAAYADGSTTSFTYDAAGRLFAATDSIGGAILNAYDALDRLTAQATGLGTITYQYDASGRRTRMDAPGQSPVFYGYDAASRLRTITQAPLNPVTIDHDALGRRTLLALPNAVSTEYQYDAASGLTALIYRNALGPLGDLTYQYDAAGNRTRIGGSFARTLLPNPVASATYDAANRQLAFGDKSMTYDANGNLTSITDPGGTTTFSWDARNRLVGLNGAGLVGSFVYDPLGRRVAKTINGQLIQSLHDGLDIIQELDVSGTSNYLRSLNIDEPLVRNGSEFYVADVLGSILTLADPAGTLPIGYTYDPFGRTTFAGAALPTPFQYTGRENDGTGLYHYRLRYLHPAIARFISEDPLGILVGTNFYSYVDNNPLTYTDPLGFQALERLRKTVADLKESRAGRAARGGAFFVVSHAVDRAIEGSPCGPVRGFLHLASAALASQGAVEFALVSFASFGITVFVPDVTFLGRAGAFVVGVGFGTLAVEATVAGSRSIGQGVRELLGQCKR
ncbi:MAG: RHS repeat protein, partial [Candidatus Rokubacteria bacterium]|nr:RHS repeat protein [Candidatus Rokubacteria bacterium]